MAQQTILGTDTVGGTGLTKLNANFTELYSAAPSGNPIEALSDVSALRAETGMSAGDARSVSYHTDQAYGGGGIFDYVSATAKSATVTAATDVLASTAHELYTGQSVVLYSISGSAPLALATTYYVVRVDANSFKLATTYANAIAATPTVVNITTDGTASVNYADDNGVWIVPSTNPASGRWKRRISNRTISPKDFGARGTGYDAPYDPVPDTNGLAGAVMYANTVGQERPGGGYEGMTIFIDGFFVPTTGFKILRRVNFKGPGQRSHGMIQLNNGTASTILFDFFAESGAANQQATNVIDGIHLIGGGAGQVAIKIGCSSGTVISNTSFDAWPTGTCIYLSNDRSGYWTEETRIDNCFFEQSGDAVYFFKGAGHASFSSTRITRCVVGAYPVDTATQRAIHVGAGALFYAGYLDMKVNVTHDETVGIYLETGASITGTFVNFLYEGYLTAEALAGTLLKMDASSVFTGNGRLYNFSNSGDVTYTIDGTAIFDLNEYIGMFTSVTALKAYPFDQLSHLVRATVEDVGGYGLIYKYDNTSTATDTSATTRTVLTPDNSTGAGRWLLQTTGPRLTSGSGVPTENGHPIGSLYLRTDGGSNTALYVKTGSTTWTPNYDTQTINTTVQDLTANAQTISLPANGETIKLISAGAARTGIILATGTVNGQPLKIVNRSAVSITFAAAGTSNLAAGVAAIIPASGGMELVWDANYAGAGVGRWVIIGV